MIKESHKLKHICFKGRTRLELLIVVEEAEGIEVVEVEVEEEGVATEGAGMVGVGSLTSWMPMAPILEATSFDESTSSTMGMSGEMVSFSFFFWSDDVVDVGVASMGVV